MVFDDIWHLTWDSLCHSCGEFWPDTVDTPVHVSYRLIHDLLCKRLGSKVSYFTRSNAVFFVVVASTNFRVWLFSHLNFCFKPCRRLNGSQETLLGLFLWLDDKQCSIFEFLSCFPPFLLPSPVTPPAPYSPRLPPPCSPPLLYISFSQIVARGVKFKWIKQARGEEVIPGITCVIWGWIWSIKN